jgi:hypothetical protein
VPIRVDDITSTLDECANLDHLDTGSVAAFQRAYRWLWKTVSQIIKSARDLIDYQILFRLGCLLLVERRDHIDSYLQMYDPERDGQKNAFLT